MSELKTGPLVGAVGIAPLAWRIQAVKRDVVREGQGLEPSNQVA